MENAERIHTLTVRSVGIETYRENIIFMRSDCDVCRSEGFKALTRIIVRHRGKAIIATLNVVHSTMISTIEAGLSEEAMTRLGVIEGDIISVAHLHPVQSLRLIRSKIYGNTLSHEDFNEIIKDVVAGHYSNIELAAFITACSADNLNLDEIIGLTRAMVGSGRQMDWGTQMVMDKHSVGGLPGNRTTPIIVSIVAAAGLTIPKTSSRAITSPAGTADTLSIMTEVNLSMEEIKRVIEQENGCFTWGGAVDISPADDILITVERALDIDSEGQMIASVLSKKKAAGSTHVIIDIPYGPTAKVRSLQNAEKLSEYFVAVGKAIGLNIDAVITDGSQPVGRGIGPSLEAMDILSVLRNEDDAPKDLKERAALLAGRLLELSGTFEKGSGYAHAISTIESGKAYEKFMAICLAQGAFREPVYAVHRHDILATETGIIRSVNCRNLSRIAKLAGAPKSHSAGVLFNVRLNQHVKKGELLYSIFAESIGELDYARQYQQTLTDLIIT